MTENSSRLFYIAWFSDTNPCTAGVPFGNPWDGFRDCNINLTILDHENITFTGCTVDDPLFGSRPTGVADNGAPALECKLANSLNPKNGSYIVCPQDPTPQRLNRGTITLLEYCS